MIIYNGDYTKLPTPILVFRPRHSLNEFFTNDLNAIIAENMQDLSLLKKCGNFEQYACSCFNCAYEICTMMMLDKYPQWRFTEFLNMPRKLHSAYPDEFQIITISIVYILLTHYSDEWQFNNAKLMGWFYDFLQCSEKNWGQFTSEGLQMYREKLSHIYETIYKCTEVNIDLTRDEFAPRVLDAQALADAQEDLYNNRTDWRRCTNNYDHQTIVDLMSMICKSEEERALVVNFIIREAAGYKQEHVAEFAKGLNLKSIEELYTSACESDYALLNHWNLELRDELDKIKQELSDYKEKVQYAENMKPTSEYHDNLRGELNNTKAELEALINSLNLYKEKELQTNEFIILFSNLLGFDLSGDSINQTAFAKFLQELSGKQGISQSSISRLSSQEQSKKYSDKVKKDAHHLILLLMEIPKDVKNGRAVILYKLIRDIYTVYGFREIDFKDLSAKKKDQFKELFEDERRQKREEERKQKLSELSS